jgi:hypothetical protein
MDHFISPIPGFEGDIPFPTILVSTRSPSSELANDPSVGAGAGASKTQAGKCKATANPAPQKKAKKAASKSIGGIKINEPTPKASPTPTPPSRSWKKILIHRSGRYTRCVYFSLLINSWFMNLYVEYSGTLIHIILQRVSWLVASTQR